MFTVLASRQPLRNRVVRLGTIVSHRLPTSCVLRYRSQSTKTALKHQKDTFGDFEEVPAPTTRDTRPFAIEHVDGRARHLTWAGDGRVLKEWREIQVSGALEDSRSHRTPRLGRITAWLRQMFLPTNYPQSVHQSYFPYHLLQFAECIVGTLVSVLCNQALLVSVGVSAEGSIFGAVAVQWIIKDGAGEVAKLFFIRRFSAYFDSHPKTFNLIGAGAVLLGSGLQIASVLGPGTTSHFLMCAAGGNIFKLIGNAVWFTTHIKFVRFFAKQGNMGDVAAKSESQASVGQLLGYASGIGLLSFSHAPAYLYAVFAVAVPLHLVITARMLRVASFEMLTLPRLSWLAGSYVTSATSLEGYSKGSGIVPLADLEAHRHTGFYGEFYKHKKDKYLRLAPKVEDVLRSARPEDRERWEACVSAFEHDRYLLYPSQSRRRKHSINVLYHPDANADDILRSILHGAALRRALLNLEFFSPKFDGCLDESERLRCSQRRLEILQKALHRSSLWTMGHFTLFKAGLEDCGWRVDEIAFADHGRRVLWASSDERNLGISATLDMDQSPHNIGRT